MCGIFGYVTKKPSHKFSAVMAQGLHADTVRGQCGTGIYAYSRKDHEYEVFKRALAGPDFVNTSQFERYNSRVADFNVAIGHNRASTIGGAADKNCHPFVFDNIALVHNGTLRNYHKLVKEPKWHHAVDSAYAAKGMAEQGEKETLELAEGYFVFVWHNSSANTFNIARNNNRDIWWITNKEEDTLFYASEYLMLHWILARNGIEVNAKHYRNANEHTWYTWDLDKGLKVPIARKFEERKPVYASTNYPATGREAWRSRDEQQLKDMGLEMYQKVAVRCTTYDRYGGVSELGTVEGHLHAPGTPQHDTRIAIHSVDRAFAEKVLTSKDKMCVVSINYCGKVWRGGDEPYIACNFPQEFDQAILDKDKAEREKKNAPKNDDETTAIEVFQGPPGVFRDKEDMFEALSSGCCYCGDPIAFSDYSKIKWIEWNATDTYPLCPACSENQQLTPELASYGRLLN